MARRLYRAGKDKIDVAELEKVGLKLKEISENYRVYPQANKEIPTQSVEKSEYNYMFGGVGEPPPEEVQKVDIDYSTQQIPF